MTYSDDTSYTRKQRHDWLLLFVTITSPVVIGVCLYAAEARTQLMINATVGPLETRAEHDRYVSEHADFAKEQLRTIDRRFEALRTEQDSVILKLEAIRETLHALDKKVDELSIRLVSRPLGESK